MNEEQYINIIALQDYKNIKADFTWENIPPFAVITGENGSGKTALLEGIRDEKFVFKDFRKKIKFINEFKLHNHDYKSDFIKDLKSSEEKLLKKHKGETDLENENSIFHALTQQTKQLFQMNKTYYPNLYKVEFEEFIKKDFSKYNEDEQKLLEGYRNALNLSEYHKHFERNNMSEEKFYLSPYEEIKEWLSHLKDRDFESKNIIFEERALISVFGSYHIEKINLQNELLQTIKETSKINDEIEKQLGKNPIDSINEILQETYSKYSLSIEFDLESAKLRLICKNDEQISVPLNSLSTGEQIILSLFLWRYKDESKGENTFAPMIFLLDEPDAHLNPKMSKTLIDILKNVIVKKLQCQVIMTTHSLSTVAYCEEKDLFYMEEGVISQANKKDCIDRLADGIMTFETALDKLQILQNSTKPILVVEGKTEEILFQKYYEKYKNQPETPFSIISANGVNNFKKFYDIFKIMNLKQLRVFLFDYDEEGQKQCESFMNRFKHKHDEEKEAIQLSKLLYVCDSEQTKSYTIENLFPFSLFQKIVKENLKFFEPIPDGFFREDLSEEQKEKLLKELITNKDKTAQNNPKIKFAEEILDLCEEKEDLKDFENLIHRIEKALGLIGEI